MCIISKEYKDIEKEFGKFAEDNGYLIGAGSGRGSEWIKIPSIESIVDECKALALKHQGILLLPGSILKYNNGELKECKKFDCRLDLFGIYGEDNKCFLRCTLEPGKKFKVSGNNLLIEGNEVPMATYIKKHNNQERKETATREFIGTKYFTFKGHTIYSLWKEFKTMKDFNLA